MSCSTTIQINQRSRSYDSKCLSRKRAAPQSKHYRVCPKVGLHLNSKLYTKHQEPKLNSFPEIALEMHFYKLNNSANVVSKYEISRPQSHNNIESSVTVSAAFV